MIAQILVQEFAKRFPDLEVVLGEPPDPVLTISSPNPEIDCLKVWDDGHEATVDVEPFTHGHFAVYEEGLSAEERAQLVVEDVLDFLAALFADRVMVWGAPGMGGWTPLGDEAKSPAWDILGVPPNVNCQLWSRPYEAERDGPTWPPCGRKSGKLSQGTA